MVNVKNLFGMAVMATALVGCSSNDNLAPDGKDNVGKAGTAYASFTINLPTTSGTRADEPVKDGTILNLILSSSTMFKIRCTLRITCSTCAARCRQINLK